MHVYGIPVCVSLDLFFLVIFENTFFFLNRKQRFYGGDLQSSTPEEYLDGRVLADESGLRHGSLSVEGDGRLPAQSGIDDRRDLLLFLQRLLLVSKNRSNTIKAHGLSNGKR